MSQFTIYRSSDPGAPQLIGATGSLITVLDAVLVNGYGSPLTASLGWTSSFSASVNSNIINQKAYRMNSKPYYMRVMDDFATHGSTTLEALVKFDEVLTNVNTPAFVNDIWVRKSIDTSTSRSWVIAGDTKTFYMFIKTGDSGTIYFSWMFGEFDSYSSGDQWNVIEIGRSATGASSANEGLDTLTSVGTTVTGHYIARPYNRIFVTSSNPSPTLVVAIGKHGDSNKGQQSHLYGQVNFTNQADGGLYLSPVWIHESSGNVRGQMRGFWQFLHPASSLNDQDTFSGTSTGNISGKTFITIAGSLNSGIYIIETSNTLS